MSNIREVRRRCAAIARTVPIPVPFDLAVLLEQLGRARRRPIHLLPFPLPPGAPCGVCIGTDRADYIVVTNAATGAQRTHIALHELAHLLLGHSLRADDNEDATRQLFPHLDPAVVRSMFARTNYTTDQEREAETLGSLIGQKAGLWAQCTTHQQPDDPAVQRLGRSLEHGPADG